MRSSEDSDGRHVARSGQVVSVSLFPAQQPLGKVNSYLTRDYLAACRGRDRPDGVLIGHKRPRPVFFPNEMEGFVTCAKDTARSASASGPTDLSLQDVSGLWALDHPFWGISGVSLDESEGNSR